MKIVAWLSFVAVALLGIAQYLSIIKLNQIEQTRHSEYKHNLGPFSCDIKPRECENLNADRMVTIVHAGHIVAQYELPIDFTEFRIVVGTK